MKKVMIFILLIIVGFILYEGRKMNEKKIDDINKWVEEILDFTKKLLYGKNVIMLDMKNLFLWQRTQKKYK